MRIITQIKNTLTNYTKSHQLKERLVFLPVKLDKNSLLFTQWLHMMNEIIGFFKQEQM